MSVYGSSDNDNDNDNSGSSERSREQTDGGFSQGYDDGEDARQDYINGENFHDSCSFDHSNSYCLGYKSGYRVSWTAAQLLH